MFRELVVAAGLAVVAQAAQAQDATIDFAAGTACSGFDLRVEITFNPNEVVKTFTDRNGNPVRLLVAGKGNALVFINLTTGANLSLKPNGAVEQATLNPDGSQSVVITGHNIIILAPTDIPAGPSTTLYVGRVAFTATADSMFTLQSTSGKSTDICAALSG